MVASYCGHEKVIDILLEAGAQLNLQSKVRLIPQLTFSEIIIISNIGSHGHSSDVGSKL